MVQQDPHCGLVHAERVFCAADPQTSSPSQAGSASKTKKIPSPNGGSTAQNSSGASSSNKRKESEPNEIVAPPSDLSPSDPLSDAEQVSANKSPKKKLRMDETSPVGQPSIAVS